MRNQEFQSRNKGFLFGTRYSLKIQPVKKEEEEEEKKKRKKSDRSRV